MRDWNLISPVAIALLALLINWPLIALPGSVPMTSLNQVTDFFVAHLPFARYIHDMWVQFGHPPLWNSMMLSGMPLMADPLAGYGYLPNWLLFLAPEPLTYTLLFILHLAWTGLGMWWFLRRQSLHPAAALFGAIAWMGTPRLIGYLGSGQVSTIFALAWYPWLLLALDAMTETLRANRAATAGAVWAMILTADIRWGFFAGLLAAAYVTARCLAVRPKPRMLIWNIVLFGSAAFALSAVLLLPLLELLTLVSRTQLSLSDRAIFSLGFREMLGLIFPQFGVLHELITYLGISTLAMAVCGLQKRQMFWIGLVLFAGIYSLGSNSFLFPILSGIIPGASLLRVPSRLWFLAALGCAVLAAYGFQRAVTFTQPARSLRGFSALSFAVGLFAILLAAGMVILTRTLPQGLLAFAVNLPILLLVVNLAFKQGQPRWLYWLLPLLVVDLLWFNASVFRTVPIPPSPPASAWLEQQPGLFRVYSPSYSVPLPNSLQLADGVNPLHIHAYAQFMHRASNLNTGSYSVSLPDIYADSRTAEKDRQALASPDSELLGLLNVRYLAADFPLAGFGPPVEQFGESRIYRNPRDRGRAWLEGEGTIQSIDWSPDRIRLDVVSNGGRVVLSEIDYPGWSVQVNGQDATIEPDHGLLRAVTVPAGRQEILFVYRPAVFYAGWMITSIGWLMLLGIAFQRFVRVAPAWRDHDKKVLE